jgi:acetyl-CoA carboxylase carboxyltransferase component
MMQTRKAGVWLPITGKKNLRAQEIAMENRPPNLFGRFCWCLFITG